MSQENTPENNQPAPDSPAWEATIDQIIGEMNASAPAPESQATEQPQAEAKPAGDQSNPAQAASDKPPGEAAQHSLQDSAQSGVAARLAEAAKAERARVSERKAWEEQQAKALADREQSLVNELLNDPQGFIKKYNLSDKQLDVIGANFYAAVLGENTPDSIREKIQGSSVESRFRALEEQNKQLKEQLLAEMQQQQQQAEAKAVLAKYEGFLGSVPANLPYLAATDSGEALQAMAQVADHIWISEGRMPEPGEVAQLIENQLAETIARYSGIGTKNVEQPPPVTSAKPQNKPQTLTETISADRAQPESLDEEARIRQATKELDELLRAELNQNR